MRLVMLVLVIKQLFFRNRVRMTISSCITVLLTLCMAFYAENIQTSQITLLNLKYQLPVRVYITNLSGDKKSNLFINGIDIDALINNSRNIYRINIIEYIGVYNYSTDLMDNFACINIFCICGF